MKKTVVMIAGIACALVIPAAQAVENENLSMQTGMYWSTGTYGNTQSTQILYIPVTGIYKGNGWKIKFTVPYLRITGPGNVLNGLGTTGGQPAQVTTRSGLGDMLASATRNVYYDKTSNLLVSVTGKVKLGTADSTQGLGTGENDYAFETDVARRQAAVTTFGKLGYKIFGSPPTYTLHNVFYGAAGLDYKLDPANNGGVMVSYRQKAVIGGYDHREALLYANHKINVNWKAQGYIVKGFSKGSPDLALGAMANYQF